MIYLSGADNVHLREVADLDVGVITTPSIGYTPAAIGKYRYWAADNACFSKGASFDLDKFLAWLARFDAATCLFASAPDVVCDWSATLARSLPVLPMIRALGFKAAIVLQNGATIETVPWDKIDCVFVGGDTAWKLSQAAELICKDAKSRGKWVHMGRVNSQRRFEIARQMGCDSVDGTFLAFGPEKNLKRMIKWFETEHQTLLF